MTSDKEENIHERVHHTGEKNLECKFCMKKFKKSNATDFHLKYLKVSIFLCMQPNKTESYH